MTKLEKKFKNYAIYVKKAIEALDAQMQLPSNQARGQRIAEILNDLEMTTDRIRHFDFGIKLSR